jgi:hypothetical protein
MDEDFDTVVAHYSTSELLELMEISRPTRDAIVQATAEFAQRYPDKPVLGRFAMDVQRALLEAFPEAKRMITRLVAVDSYYRETLDADNSTDTFSFTIAERLVGVTSIALYSVEIPYSWYTFAAAKGTTTVVLITANALSERVAIPCSIAEGNYAAVALLAALTKAMNDGLATLGFMTAPTVTWTLDAYSGCTTCTVNNLPSPLILQWFDPTFQTTALSTTRINKSLGWALGFRRDQTLVNPTAVAPSLLSVNPTKSIFMRLNDHVAGRFTNGVVSLGHIDANRPTLDLSKQDVSFRVGGAGRDTHTQAIAPRRLTAKQLFASNAVADSTITFSRTRDAPVDTDLFAKIPLKKPGEWGVYQPDGDLFSSADDGPTKTITEFSGPLQLNVRDYFGPVTLNTLSVSLYDDRGNILGLNGLDWSFTLLVKQERTQA